MFQIYLPEWSATVSSSVGSLVVLLEVLGKSLVVSLEGVGRVEMSEMTRSTKKTDIFVEMLIVECGFAWNTVWISSQLIHDLF